MDDRTLSRLRIAFALLGVLLLAPLFLLVRSAQARLEEQRRLRHEIVAERIFDEMERELTALLERERARPSSVYDAPSTRAETWAPFVVGYFTRDVGGVQVIAREQLDAARAARVESAAQHSWRGAAREWLQLEPPSLGGGSVSVPLPVPEPKASPRAARLDEDDVTQQDAVLRKLNRGAKARQPARRKSAPASDDHRKQAGGDDPLSGMDDL